MKLPKTAFGPQEWFPLLVGGIFLVGMILLTCADILFRTLGFPVQGAFELMGFFGAIAGTSALGHTQTRRGHIAVDILLRRFPKPVARSLSALNHLLCGVFFTLIAWQVAEKGLILLRTGEVSETLRVGYWPFLFGMAAGCFWLALALFHDAWKDVAVLLGSSGRAS